MFLVWKLLSKDGSFGILFFFLFVIYFTFNDLPLQIFACNLFAKIQFIFNI